MFSKAAINRIVRMARSGKTVKEIVTDTGRSPLSVRKWLKVRGVKARRGAGGNGPSHPPEFYKVIAERLKTETLQSIANEYGITRERVRQWALRADFRKNDYRESVNEVKVAEAVKKLGETPNLNQVCRETGIYPYNVTNTIGHVGDYGPYVAAREDKRNKCVKCGAEIDRTKRCMKKVNLCVPHWRENNAIRTRTYLARRRRQEGIPEIPGRGVPRKYP